MGTKLVSKATTHLGRKAILGIWRALNKIARASSKSGTYIPGVRNFWDEHEQPFWRWNSGDRRPVLSEEVDSLRDFLEQTAALHSKMSKALDIGQELLGRLDRTISTCGDCRGKGGGRIGGRPWKDCVTCDGWGMISDGR